MRMDEKGYSQRITEAPGTATLQVFLNRKSIITFFSGPDQQEHHYCITSYWLADSAQRDYFSLRAL